MIPPPTKSQRASNPLKATAIPAKPSARTLARRREALLAACDAARRTSIDSRAREIAARYTAQAAQAAHWEARAVAAAAGQAAMRDTLGLLAAKNRTLAGAVGALQAQNQALARALSAAQNGLALFQRARGVRPMDARARDTRPVYVAPTLRIVTTGVHVPPAPARN